MSVSELLPADADEEQRGQERRAVHERRPQVRLQEHEQDRDDAEADRGEDRAPARHAPGALDEEARDREDEEHLAELRGLELDDAEVEPALRAADRLGGEEHEHHQRRASRT